MHEEVILLKEAVYHTYRQTVLILYYNLLAPSRRHACNWDQTAGLEGMATSTGPSSHPPRCWPKRCPLTKTSASQSTAPKLSRMRCARGQSLLGSDQLCGTVKLRRYHMRTVPASARPTPVGTQGNPLNHVASAHLTVCGEKKASHSPSTV